MCLQTMDRVYFRKQIEILFLIGKKPEEIHQILVQQYGSDAPCRATVYNWVRQVKNNDKNLRDQARSGRPASATTSSNIEKIRRAIEESPKSSTRMLASIIRISKESIRKILDEDLNMVKMNSRWVPKELTESQKQARVRSCKQNLKLWNGHWTELIERIVTVDETWIKYENCPSRTSGAEWRLRGSRPPEIPKLPTDSRKIMATVFWDSKGILLFDVLPKNSTVTGQYYSELLNQLREEIKSKRRGKLTKKIILLQDNARVHTCRLVTETIEKHGWTTLDHPPYSPDLAPSDFFLFKNLKIFLQGKNFSEKDKLVSAVIEFYESKGVEFFLEPFERLKVRMKRCIDDGGEYFDWKKN